MAYQLLALDAHCVCDRELFAVRVALNVIHRFVTFRQAIAEVRIIG